MNSNKGKRTNLSSNVLQLQVNKFVSNRNNQILTPSYPINSILNSNGFLEILNGAIKCTGKVVLESVIPKEGDLSIKQNNGFSFFIWVYVSNFQKKENPDDKTIYYIFRKGSSIDEFTPEMGVIESSEKHFVVGLATSSQKKIMLLANKAIEENHLYSFGVTFDVNYEQDCTDVNIFIDGKLDTQTRLEGQPLHNQGNIYFGKIDVTSKSFKGVVADLILTPNVLKESEINFIHNEGLRYLYETNGEKLNMNLVFNEIFKKKRLINKYAFYTGKNVFEIENLDLSAEKMLEIVKNYDEEEKKNDVRVPPPQKNIKYEKMIENMNIFLSDEDQRIYCNKIDMNRNLIHTCLYLANQGEDNLEIERVYNIFDTLKEILLFEISEEFLTKLSKILNSYLESNEKNKVQKYIITNKFFENLNKSLNAFETKEIKEEIENEKYNIKKKKKNKNENLNYLLRRNINEKNEPLSPEKTKGFGDCIPEHEKLLLHNEINGNYIEEKQDDNLKNFNSLVRIKDLYEVPKNLPGEDENMPDVQIIPSENSSKRNNTNDINDKSTTNINETNNSISTARSFRIKRVKLNDKDKAEKNLVHNMLLDILDEKPDRVITPELGINTTPAIAELIEKDIMRQREEIKKKFESIKSQKIEEELSLEKNKEEKPITIIEKEINLFTPNIIPEWCDGNFQIVINHCHDCHTHTNTTRHYEYQFVDKFNEIAEAIKNKFPNAVIIGNQEEQEYYGNFDVYLCNIGIKNKIKNKSNEKEKEINNNETNNERYLIYSKYITNKFPTVNEILDKLITLVIMYGSSLNLEKSQNKIKSSSKLNITHEYPAELSEPGEKIKNKLLEKKPEFKIDEERTKFFCTNNGCNKIFVRKENGPKKCSYHPGVYQFGTYNGLWPECWTCCEGKWNSPGCKQGQHKEVLLQDRLMLCLNHGELNNKGFPDSVCGTWYTERSNNNCKYHPGHIEKNKYTCCDQSEESQGCVEGPHETATYPEEKAKLYFYPKYINNPGLEKKVIPVAQLIKNCQYFKETKAYPDYKALMEQENKKKEEELEMPRRCFNIGCNAIFTQKENTSNSCMCHTGHWDFGATKFKLGFIGEEDDGEEIKREQIYQQEREKKILIEKEMNKKKKKKSRELRFTKLEPCYGKWRPQWTCCGGRWDAEPCTPCFHHGPLLQDEEKYKRKYVYPNIRLQFTFKRIISDRWKNYISNFIYDESKVRKICRNFLMKKGKINLYNIHELFNLLKLKYVIEQEDPSIFLKYRDLSLKQETFKCLCDEGNNNIDVNRFIKWWFSDYITLYNEIHPTQ